MSHFHYLLHIEYTKYHLSFYFNLYYNNSYFHYYTSDLIRKMGCGDLVFYALFIIIISYGSQHFVRICILQFDTFQQKNILYWMEISSI